MSDHDQAGEVVVACVVCGVVYEIPKEEDPGDEPYFCETYDCVRAAYRYHVG